MYRDKSWVKPNKALRANKNRAVFNSSVVIREGKGLAGIIEPKDKVTMLRAVRRALFAKWPSVSPEKTRSEDILIVFIKYI